MKTAREAPMRSAWIAGAVIAVTISSATAVADAAEIRLAEQFSMGYLQFNVMKRDNPELYGAFLDAVKEATSIIAADPKGTAQSWINDSNSKLPLEMVTKVVTAANVEWTMTPAATMKFAKFMRRVGTIKREPASWKDLFFPEIGSLNGS
jgi:ABC-type nitrate/sulfonate/bicarbonate transport system substrate-binding protein